MFPDYQRLPAAGSPDHWGLRLWLWGRRSVSMRVGTLASQAWALSPQAMWWQILKWDFPKSHLLCSSSP